MFRATDRWWPTGCKQGGADETAIHLFNVKTGKTLEDELPAARYFGVCLRPMGRASTTRATTRRERCSTSMCWERGSRADTLIFGREFRGEALGPNDLFRARDHRRRPLPGDPDRPRCAREARGHCLPRPDQAGLAFEVLVWGLDSRFSAIYAKGAWYVKTDYKAPNGASRPPIPASCPTRGRRLCPRGRM